MQLFSVCFEEKKNYQKKKKNPKEKHPYASIYAATTVQP